MQTALWRRAGFRAVFMQAVVLLVVAGFFWAITQNALSNLRSQGIATGFDFLGESAGFGIIQSLIDYSEASSYGRAFLVGLLNTLLVSGLGIVFATILGFVIGIARMSPNWIIRQWATVYIELFRNVPLLLQIFFWYFAVLRPLPGPRDSYALWESVFLNNRGIIVPAPIYETGFTWCVLAFVVGIVAWLLLTCWSKRQHIQTGRRPRVWPIGLACTIILPLIASAILDFPLGWDVPEFKRFNFQGGWVLLPEFMALLMALSIYTAAFIAEVVRSGIQSVGKSQHEAAQALGLSPGLTLRLVIIPQALRVIIPPLTNQYLNLMKNSSLAAAIAYPDLVSVFAGTVLNQTGQAIEVIAITMAVYLSLSLSISLLMNWYNRRKAIIE